MARIARGYTLVEAVVVVAVLSVISVAVVPSLVAIKRSQEERSFLSGLTTMAGLAREDAITEKQQIDIEFDEQKNAFRLHGTGQNSQDYYFSTMAVPAGFRVDRYVDGTTDTDAGSWKLNFYPDGTSDGGGVQLTKPDTSTVSLYIDPGTGLAKLNADQLPDKSTLSWPAGDYVHRG